MKKRNSIPIVILITLIIVFIMSCQNSDENSDRGIDDQTVVEEQLNLGLELPPGTFTVDPEDESIEIDDSIEIDNGSGAVMPLNINQNITVNINFSAPNGNVDAVGMRFGTNGPIHFVPISTNGATSGTGSFQFRITPEMCNNLSQICHDIRCYEFAHTADGKISRANINQVALTCGNCDEPSCQGLIDPKICSINCDLITDFQTGQGTYYDSYITALNNFTGNPTTQTCNAFYDEWEIFVLALLECTQLNDFDGQNLQETLEFIRQERQDGLCDIDFD